MRPEEPTPTLEPVQSNQPKPTTEGISGGEDRDHTGVTTGTTTGVESEPGPTRLEPKTVPFPLSEGVHKEVVKRRMTHCPDCDRDWRRPIYTGLHTPHDWYCPLCDTINGKKFTSMKTPEPFHDTSPDPIKEQPPPISSPEPKEGGESGSVWAMVLRDMSERERIGIEKYGLPVLWNNGRDHIVDAYQEALDKIVYLRAEILKRQYVKDALNEVLGLLDTCYPEDDAKATHMIREIIKIL